MKGRSFSFKENCRLLPEKQACFLPFYQKEKGEQR